jgi:hypothetical protein
MSRKVSQIEFKRLLCDIRDRRPDVRVRVRLIGKMWSEHFCSVDFINENQVVLFSQPDGLYQYINNIGDIINFELECSFFGFRAFYHYEVLAAGQSEIAMQPHAPHTGNFPNSR